MQSPPTRTRACSHAERHPLKGMILAFRRHAPQPTLFRSLLDRLIALSTRGPHVHVEVLFVQEQEESARGLTEEKKFILPNESFTAFMYDTFRTYSVSPDAYPPGLWDLLFVPMDHCQLDIARQWARSQVGVRYDYIDAFTCPFVRLQSHGTHNTVAPKQGLFCSEAALYMLQIAGAARGDAATASPIHCSPAALFRLLSPNAAHIDRSACHVPLPEHEPTQYPQSTACT
eukprot:3062887-Rhodomonas_salina.1